MQHKFFSSHYLLIILFLAVTLAAIFVYKQPTDNMQKITEQEIIVSKETISAMPEKKDTIQTTETLLVPEISAPTEQKQTLSILAAPTSDKPLHATPKDYCKGHTSITAEFQLKELDIEGSIPSWLYGSFVSVGPAKFEIGEHRAKHWLEGFAMIHRFSFKNGHVSYANRFLETTYSTESIEKGKFSANSASDPNASYFSRLAAALSSSNDRPPYDNANINIIQHGNCCMALTETPHAVVYDTRTLKTKGLCVYKDDLEPHVSTAHPLIDKETGDLYNVATTYAKKSTVTVYKMNQGTMNRIPLTTFSASYPSYMHSFAMSKRYLIITEIPFVVNPYDLVLSGKPYIENFQWKPRQKTKITVINKSNGAILRTYELPPFFTFHHINAYDTGSQVVVDLITLPDSSHMRSFFFDQHNVNFPQGTVSRIMLDLNSSNAKMSSLSPIPLEMPRISPLVIGKQYRYLYGLNSSYDNGYYDRIIKLDITNEKYTGWHQDYCYVSESVFVPRPDGESEDDGVVISTILNTQTENSSLILLDGITFKLIAQVQLPHHIPFTTHSTYLAKHKK